MQDPKSKILNYHRLRPQKKGKLPNFTKDFQAYSQQIDQVVKNKVQFTINLNKFTNQKNNKLLIIKKKPPEESIISQPSLNKSNLSIPSIFGCNKYLKYNETIINPHHKIKITNKSLKKLKKQHSEPSFIESKIQKRQNTQKSINKLPKLVYTSRQRKPQKVFLTEKQNVRQSRTARFQNHKLSSGRKQGYLKIYHILTMGRKEITV